MPENIEHDGATCDVCGRPDEDFPDWDGVCGNCPEHCAHYEGCPPRVGVLKPLIYTEAEVAEALIEFIDATYGEDGYEFSKDSWGFETSVGVVSEALNLLVDRMPPNGDEYECIAYTIAADPDGVIQGYEFQYMPTAGAHIGTRFVEYRHILPEADGEAGQLELAFTIIALLNHGIEAMNELYASLGGK